MGSQISSLWYTYWYHSLKYFLKQKKIFWLKIQLIPYGHIWVENRKKSGKEIKVWQNIHSSNLFQLLFFPWFLACRISHSISDCVLQTGVYPRWEIKFLHSIILTLIISWNIFSKNKKNQKKPPILVALSPTDPSWPYLDWKDKENVEKKLRCGKHTFRSVVSVFSNVSCTWNIPYVLLPIC